MSEIVLASGISKSYGPVTALKDATLHVHEEEIVGLVGDNGAGKSTLVKILSGVVTPDGGQYIYDGKPVNFTNARDARLAGIEAVHQDLGLCDNLAVYKNIFLGRELLHRYGPIPVLAKREMAEESSRLLLQMQIGLSSPLTRTSVLSGGQRQMVAIARALKWHSKLVLLDEPTAALSVEVAERVLAAIEQLRNAGASILVISHDIPHILKTCDRVVVLRHGKTIASVKSQDVSAQELVGLMTGAVLPAQVRTMTSSVDEEYGG